MSRLLIVEDEESIADLEKDYLELSGFEVDIEKMDLRFASRLEKKKTPRLFW